MRYRVFQGYPKCGRKALRQITREHAEMLIGKEYPNPYDEKTKYFHCRNEKCFHVFSRAPSELIMEKKKEAGCSS